MHVPHRVEIAGPRGPDLDRGAIGQQSVGGGLSLCAHVILPGPAASSDDAPNPRIIGYRASSDRVAASLAGTDAHRALHRSQPDLAVADRLGACMLRDGL